jgi:hypothetical protein
LAKLQENAPLLKCFKQSSQKFWLVTRAHLSLTDMALNTRHSGKKGRSWFPQVGTLHLNAVPCAGGRGGRMPLLDLILRLGRAVGSSLLLLAGCCAGCNY